jgi:thioredoxin-related protein
MKYLLTIIGIITILTVKAQGINFEQNLAWKQIQAKAKLENKYIFMDVFATWCGPCEEMSVKVFPKQETGYFINSNFIALKVQMDQTNEDNDQIKSWYADAKAIGAEYQVNAYPTILFFAPSGELAGRAVGYKEAHELIADAKQAMANSEEFGKLYMQYSKGNRDSALVKGVARLSLKMGQTENAQKIAQQYINSLDEQELFKSGNLLFVSQFTTSSKDKGFSLFRKYNNKVNAVLGNNVAETKVTGIIVKEEIETFTKNKTSTPDWKVMETNIKNKYGALGLEAYYGERMSYALNRMDWSNFGKYYALYYSTACSRSRFHINNISWLVVEHVSDPAVLETAVKTMKYDIEHFDQHNLQAYDTYANLLYKTGKKDEAIEWESKAARIEEENASKNNGKPDPVFAETLEKMKNGRDEPCPSSRR